MSHRINTELMLHPSYGMAFHLAALSSLGTDPRHELYWLHACDLIHGLMDDFGIREDSPLCDLLHGALGAALGAAADGDLDSDPQFQRFVRAERNGDVLAFLRGEKPISDFF